MACIVFATMRPMSRSLSGSSRFVIVIGSSLADFVGFDGCQSHHQPAFFSRCRIGFSRAGRASRSNSGRIFSRPFR